MSGLAERVVELAADQLPEPERSRRSEEWGADLEGAKEYGVSRFGIAFGALTFALKAPVASPVAADWWARWALMFAAIGPVVWLSLRTSGLYMSNPELRDAVRPLMVVAALVAIGLIVLVGMRTRAFPWRASGTVILLCLSGLVWVLGTPATSRFAWLMMAALAIAVAGLVIVAVRLRRRDGTAHSHVVALLVLTALPIMVVVWDNAGPFGWWVPVAFAVVAAAVSLVVVALRPPGAEVERPDVQLRAASITVVVTASLVIALTIAAIVSLVTWNPGVGAKAWAVHLPELIASVPPFGIGAAVSAALFLVLASVARRRRATRGIAGLGFVLAGALAGLGSVVPVHGVGWLLSYGIAFLGCGLAVTGADLLLAPRERSAESEAPEPA